MFTPRGASAPKNEGASDGQRPIDWEGDTGRVLSPIAMGELEGPAIWGRVLKHYGTVKMDSGAGRG